MHILRITPWDWTILVYFFGTMEASVGGQMVAKWLFIAICAIGDVDVDVGFKTLLSV